jgi:hypothetical protein
MLSPAVNFPADGMNVTAQFRRWPGTLILVGLLLAYGPAGRGANRAALPRARTDQKHQLLANKSGSFPTWAGMTLHLVVDRGDVVIRTQDFPRVDYRLRVETSIGTAMDPALANSLVVWGRSTPVGVILRAQTPDAEFWQTGNVWVTLEVTIPKNYGVIVSTQGGSIQTGDLRGRTSLATGGGNISTGNIDGFAHLTTEGGHITVKNVSGDLDADTGGGHITVGNIAGSANLHTRGGHIRVASAGRGARLDTGGGNISLGSSGMGLLAQTGGGQIEVGEAKGAIRAFTAGGGIRVVSSKGPTMLQTDSGSIYLTRVDSAVRAQTHAGAITAWLNSDTRLLKPCVLESGQGDIVVYLPANLPLTIDATVQVGDERQIFVDPALGMKVSTGIGANGAREVRAEGALNGGGELLRVRTVQGNIRLLLNDADHEAALSKQQMDDLNKQLREQLKAMQSANPNLQ